MLLRTLLHYIERRNSIGLAHGRKVEDLFDEKIGSRARGYGGLPQVNQLRRPLTEHLDAQDAR